MNYSDVIAALNDVMSASPRNTIGVKRFFKTGPGQYGEGDEFIGLTVPEQRRVARSFTTLPLSEIVKLLQQPVHEYRFTALILMVERFRTGTSLEKAKVYAAYLANSRWINNWDLVDASAEFIVGPQTTPDVKTLIELAHSNLIWDRRIAMLACFYDIKQGDSSRAYAVIDVLKHDDHDLIQKAVGWMLREIGKRCGRDILIDWLDKEDCYQRLPRTTLRYAIEHFSAEERQHYLKRAQPTEPS